MRRCSSASASASSARDGDVFGVVGRKAIHLIKHDDRDKAAKLTDLWVDIGASNKAEAMTRLAVGDPGVIDSKAMDFPNHRLVSRSIDDRIGAFVVLEALRRYAAKPGAARVIAVATTQEEIAWHGGGAAVSAAASGAAMAIVVDVTHATDTPGIEKKEIGDNPLGGGPVLSRGSIVSPVVLRLLRTTADELKIPYTHARRGTRHRHRRRRDPRRARGDRDRPRLGAPTATCTRRTRW